MFRIAVEIESLRSSDRMITYSKSYLDLAEIATVIDNSGTDKAWKICLKSGKEMTVQPCKDQRLSFDEFVKAISSAKLQKSARDDGDGEADDESREGTMHSRQYKGS